MPAQPHPPARPVKSRRRLILALSAVIGSLVVVALLIGVFSRGADGNHRTAEAVLGSLNIEVIEGGSVEARESQEFKSEIRGYTGTKILSIVEEGITITAEDVANELVLVQLDTSDLVERLTTADIQFKGTQAKLTEARQAYEIQMNQSKSDIDTAELELKFARMDLNKYLGAEVSKEVLFKIREFEETANAAEPTPPDNSDVDGEGLLPSKTLLEESGALDPVDPPDTAKPETTTDEADAEPLEMSLTFLGGGLPQIDFDQYADPELLGDGDAAQKLRKTTEDTLVAQKELGLAKSNLDGQKKLLDRGFLTTTEYENFQLDVEKKENSVRSTVAAQSLFLNFDFPKESEKLMSGYLQAQRKLVRAESKAISEMAKATANQLSAEAKERLEREKIKDLKEQIEKCTIRATSPGLVLYGSGDSRYRWYGQDQIKEGALVRQRQAIITIPDTTKMTVKISVHEVEVKKVKVGQTATIRIDAEADKTLTGEVVKVGVLPDSENRYMNPDLKVYKATIDIEGVHDWLKPGMSAMVTINVDHLKDVVYIPIQAVVPKGSEQICYVLEGSTPVPRVVETGENTLEYIVVTKGIAEGENVLLRPPAGSRQDEIGDEQSDADEDDATDEADGEDKSDAAATEEEEGGAPETDTDEAADTSPETTPTDVQEG